MAYPESFANITFHMLSIFNILGAFPSEDDAIEFSVEAGLIPGHNVEKRCLKCKRQFVFEKRSDRKPGWRYRCPKCKKSLSPLINTFFEETRCDIRDILLIIFCFVSDLSVTTLVEQYKISEKTIIQWYTYCREVCMTIMNTDSEDELIGGEDMFVEVDEALLSSRKDNKGRVLKGQQIWVLGMICRETKQCKIIRVHDRKKKTLLPLMQKYIHPDSYIVTDSAKVYVNCNKYGFASHYSVCHQRYFVCPKEKLIYTNTIENLWSRLKPAIKSHQTKLHIDHYIGEWCYRERYFKEFDSQTKSYNRVSPGLRFEIFIKDIIRLYPGINKEGIKNPYFDHQSPENSDTELSNSDTDVESDESESNGTDIEERHLIIGTSNTILNHFMNSMVYRQPHLNLLKVAIHKHLDDIKNVLIHLRAASVQNFQEDLMRVDPIRNQLPKAFLDNYLPATTTGDGDCFYNAVSLSLFGNEQYSAPLRLATVAMLYKYRKDLEEAVTRIRYDIDDAICGAGTTANLLGLARTSYTMDLMREYHWANTVSTFGTSLAIGRPIYIYFGFRDSDNSWLWNANHLTSEQLNRLDRNGAIDVCGCESYRRRKPVRVFLQALHYTALLADCSQPFEFRPTRTSDLHPIAVQNSDASQRDDA